MEEIRIRLQKFALERDWKQFHTPSNLAKSIAIEAGELLENFQWSNDYDQEKVVEELADVTNYCIMLADALGINLIEALHHKIDRNELKYPVEKAKGNSKKYTEF